MNLTLEDVYNQPAAIFSKIFTDIALICRVVLAPITIYVIMTQSTKMKTYRWFLIYNIFWNIMVELCLAIASPALLSPYFVFIFNSVFGNSIDHQIWFTGVEVFIFCAYNMATSYIVSALY